MAIKTQHIPGERKPLRKGNIESYRVASSGKMQVMGVVVTDQNRDYPLNSILDGQDEDIIPVKEDVGLSKHCIDGLADESENQHIRGSIV